MRTNLLNDLSNVLKKGTSMNLLPKMDRECIENDSRMDRQSLGKIFRYAAMITLLLTLACGNVWADDRGFWTDDGAYVRFYRNNTYEYGCTVDGSGVDDYDLGNIDSDGGLYWTDLSAKTWYSNMFESVTFYWRVKGRDAGEGPDYSNYGLGWRHDFESGGHSHGYWDQASKSETCSTTGLAAGNYEVEFFWAAYGKDKKTYYLSNGGSNYHANFTLRRKITYHTDGSTAGSAPSPSTEWWDDAATVRDNTGLLRRSDGKVFAGWANSLDRANAGTIDHEPGKSNMSVTLTADLDLYPVWKDGSYLFQLKGSDSSSDINTTDFGAGGNKTNTVLEVNGVTFSKTYYKTSNSQSKIKQQYQNPNYFIVYDTKSTATTIRVYVKNTDTSIRNVYYLLAKEGSISESDQTESLAAGEAKVINIDVSNTNENYKGTRVILCTDKYDKVFFAQIIAIESGTTLPLPGEAGYELAFPGRVANHFPNINGIEITGQAADLKWNYGNVLKLRSGSSKYLKFITTAATKLQVKIQSGKGFYVCTNKSNPSTTGFLTSGSTAGTKDIYLDAANTYYIMGEDGSNDTKIEKVSFAAHSACTAPTGLAASLITYSGATFTVTDGTNANNYEFYVSTSSTAPTASTTPTYTSTSKTLAVDDLNKNTTYYAWVRTNGGYFHKSAWTALTGTSFKTLNAYDITYNCDGATYGCPEDGVGLALPNPLPDAPFKAGYSFDGWFTNSGKTISAVAGASISENTTLYAKWTKVYATTKDFTTSKTQGTIPNQKTITTSYAAYTPFRVDNFFFGSTNKLCFETGNSSDKFNGWKFQYSGSVIKFFVENDCSVAVELGANAGCSITYTPIDGVQTTESLSTSDNITTTKDVEGGTMVTLTTTDGGTVTLQSITITDKAACTTNPTVTAGSNSAVTPTTATVSCASGISSLGSAGCSITSYGFVIGTSANPAIGGSGVTQHQVGTSYASTGTSFSKNLTGLTAGTTYYVRPYATNGNGTAYGAQTSFTTLPTTPTFSPASGSTVNGSQTITITGHSGSTVYYVWATSAQSASDIYNSGSGSHGTAGAGTASVTVQSGKTLYAISRISDTNSAVGSASYTVDAIAPSVSSATPASSATDVSISGNVTFTFSENVTIVDASKFAISPSAGVTWSTGSATVDGATVTIPYSGLSYSTVYTISAAAGAVKDAVNNTSTAWAGHSFTTEAEPVLYTVTYTYNGATGGSSTESSSQASEGASITLPTPTKTNYTFQGWYESGGTKAGNGGATYEPEADITLYALWRADCAGGGGGGGTLFSQNFSGSGSLTYTQDVGYTKKSGLTGIVGNAANLFTSITTSNKNTTGIAINHATGGNSVNATGIFQAYFNNTGGYWSVIRTNDFAATAPTAVKMSMDFYLDQLGSSSSAVMVNFAIGDGFSESLKSSSAESTSNIHSGWGITVESSMKMCAYDTYGTKIYNTALSNKTWYSVTWVINNTGSDLTYDDPDGSGTTTLANDKFDIWLKTQAQTASNYTKVVSARDAITASKALQELYIGHASGKKHEFRMDNIVVTDLTPSGGDCYYVTYNGNGATGGFTKDETAYALNANPTVASNSFTKTGYTFTGWNTAPGGGGTAYAAGGTISNISADVTLYAQWAADAATYELTWNTNGGSDLVCSGTCTSGDLAYGATIVAPTDPTKSNYTFDGWNTANDGSGSAAAATMPAANTTYYAAWKQTVTLNTGSQGSEANKTPYVYLNGAELSDDAVHSAAGYTLTGYYTETSGGTKVLNVDGTFVTSADGYITASKWTRTGAAPTLYAQWRAASGSTCYEWDATEDAAEAGTNVNHNGLYLTATTTSSQQLNSSDETAYTCFDVSSGEKLLKGNLNGLEIASVKFAANTSNAEKTTFVIAFCSTTTFSMDHILQKSSYDATVYDVNVKTAAKTEFEVTAPTGTKSFALGRNLPGAAGTDYTVSKTLQNKNSRFLYYIKACTASGGTHTISYNNGGGSGTMTSDASIADDGSKAIKTNTFTAPSNFAFAGWVADVDVTISGNTVTAGMLIANGATITNITTDIALTAKWSQTITLDKNSSNHGTGDNGSATVYYNATELASITHTTPASGYKLVGYYTETSGGTKVLNADGTFAGTAVSGYITDGKWTQSSTSTPTLHAQYELAGGIVTNTLKVGANKWGSSISTSEPTLITSLNALAAVGGLTIENANGTTASGTALTCKIEASGATSKTDSKYLQLSFTIATGYKLNVTGIGMTVRSVSKDGKYHIELAGTTGSLTPDDETVGSGSIAAIFDDTYNQDFTGTVTLKLWAYGKDGDNLMSEYRLANPITIYGTLIETCTMPSYSSVTYTKTEYTVSETSSAITVTSPSDVTSYQWKYNSTGDRTSGTNADAVGTGAATASFTPSTSVAHEKRYYWCELTNACGTIKTEAVGVTVSTSKSTATVTWSNPGTVNYGGGGYTLRATVDQSAWDGTASDLTITAPAGINIYGVTSGTDGSSKKYVEVTFDVQTSFDRSTYAENIPFTVSAAATTNYNAISNEQNVAYVACSGGGGEGSAFIEVTSSVTTAKSGMSNYWEAAGVGRLNKAYNQSMGSSADAQTIEGHAFSYRTGANNSNWMVNTYIAGVTKIRLYFYASAAIASGKLGISKVLYDTEYFSSQGDRSVVFSNVETSAASYAVADKGWIEFELPEMAANSYCYFATNTGNLYIYGVELFSESVGSGGTLNTHLQWSGGLADGDIVSKSTNDAYFTYSASKITENMNTLGAITYSSSVPSVATVDATGKVSMVAAGSTTIKATLAASGCYKKAEISYTLNVSEPVCSIAAGTLELTSGSETKCEGNEVTLTLTGFESGATLQWKDGDTDVNHNGSTYKIAKAGTTSTLTTNQPGTYSVMVTSGCSVRSNRITISNKSTSVSAERDVKTWYVKNGRMTPDIELWSLSEGTHLSSVAFTRSDAGDATAIGLSNSDVYESDGKVYLKGTAPSANSTGSDIAYTLTLTVTDECNNTTTLSASDKQITLYHQKNTDKHVVAFVVTGTEKGGFTEGVPSNQTTEIDLYKAIAAEFDVVATNVYSTDDEQAIKEYYSQFDILCVTDYPDTNTKGAKKQSYVNALGSLIDIRPILTMEAFVAKWSNWAAKGISGTPKSPDPKQYAMDLQCKDHEIFDGTDWSTVGTGDEMMYRVTMVSSTSYPSKPALQGFTFDATMVADGLLPLGQIYNGSTETLQVGIERQNEMTARLMVLGINSVAMERLTDDGQRVVINALKYLMKKNEEDIADCSVSFVGGAEEGSKTDWNNDANWSTGKRPDKTTREVRILAPCVITDGQTITSPTIKIADGGTYDGGTKADGKLTINAGGVLKVKGEVVGVTAPAYSKKKATEASRLELETSASKQSALILKNENGMTRATVNFYSLGRTTDKYQFQYMAIPMEYVDIHPAFSGKGIYTYVYHEATGWERRGYYSYLEAFEGVGITTKFTEARTYTMTGTLASTEEREITLTKTAEKNGDNLIGNSWTAPIQISELEKAETTATLASKTVYIYCAGHDRASVEYGTTETPGQWLAIPFNAAGFSDWTGLKVIPAMNAFELMATAGGTITLNYDTLVRGGELLNLTEKARTPRRMASHEGIELTRIRVSDTKTHTDLHLFEGDGFSEEFDDGWEAEYMEGDGISAQFYAVNGDNKMAVLADQSLEGTVLGFAPGQELTYTFSFAGEDNGYYLNDIKLETATPINEAETYTFTYEEGDTNRFYISRTAINAPQVTTGMGNTGDGVKAKKILYNDKLYIIVNGRVYSADGAIVK